MKIKKQNEKGIALLASMMMIIILTLIGFRIAEQGKANTAITGSNVRYNQVFEAAEQTMRDAIFFMQAIQGGNPITSSNPSTFYTDSTSTKDIFANFNVDRIYNSSINELTSAGQQLPINPEYAFVWSAGSLENFLCPTTCLEGIDFFESQDSDAWEQQSITSIYDNSTAPTAVTGDNYLQNIRTYAFVQELVGTGVGGTSSTDLFYATANKVNGSSSGSSGSGSSSFHYLITIKASGFPPGTTNFTATEARENVIVQAIFSQAY